MEISSILSSQGRLGSQRQEVVSQVSSELIKDKQDPHYQSKSEIEKEIAGLNKLLQATNTHLKFTLHEELNEYYVQVINEESNEVVKEIPSKKVMDMVAKMHEMIGLLVDEKR
ncbi:flagellar protein FlaG [Brevibacillus invocatus]|uniref:Flagellar protein FlaG n=1 Tax=Brevibacillus invocatus TaxID=173959 RepID=A0A3M8CNB9_9BACL|nr:flagellar protein FlaG [Brevibacillus invocatus]RNB77079.1 flagellar protein FlaG [Brevibacillus invocatus]